jgi:hypothetical protein
MPSNLPARVDRAAIERIIQRAAELQTGEREIGDDLSPDEVVSLGKEVGIPERYLRQALLEESTRSVLPAGRALLDRVIGPAEAVAQRVVRGDAEAVEPTLLRWMHEEELLAVQRQLPGRITWEPLTGMQAALRRSSAILGGTRRPYMLSRARLVTAVLTGLEPGYSHVTLTADLRPARAAVLGGAAAIGSIGIAAALALTVMTPFWWVAVAPLPLFAGGAWGIAQIHRPRVERAQLGLERALDHLERGDVKPAHALPGRGAGVMSAVLDEVRKALKP